MMFTSLNEQAPVYLQNVFHERSTDYDLRNSSHKLTLPRSRTNYLKRVSVTVVLGCGIHYPKM